MNDNNKEKKLKDAELDKVSGGITDGVTAQCPRAFTKYCPGGGPHSKYKECPHFNKYFECREGHLLMKYRLPIGPEHYNYK